MPHYAKMGSKFGFTHAELQSRVAQFTIYPKNFEACGLLKQTADQNRSYSTLKLLPLPEMSDRLLLPFAAMVGDEDQLPHF